MPPSSVTPFPSPAPAPPSSYRFGNVCLVPLERRLQVDGSDVSIGARAFEVLLALIERRERLVTRDELLDLVWDGAAVEPNNLSVQIGTLRKVLGPHVIATVPGRGYRLVTSVDERPAESTPRPRTEVRRTNLPALLSTMFGRDDDLQRVGELLDAHRLVTVVGPGGIGKTRLAQWLLHRRRDTFQHGVCWIELESIRSAASLPGAIAAGLGITLAGGASIGALKAVLAPLEMLIALDNAEHLLTELGEVIDALATAAPNVRLLVTSQAPLRLPQEQPYRLDALAWPSGEATLPQVLEYGAVQLFVARAKAVDARFALTSSNAATVIALCRRLDGLPLAIEFAAARAPLLGVERILESLDDRMRILTTGFRSAPPRQQTMAATLDWSHGLLDAEEQIVFRRLAVIAGSASLELVQAFVADPPDAADAGAAGLDRWTLLDALGSLIDRSLVALVTLDGDPDRPRYRLLETPRAYAADRLAAAGEAAMVEARHARAVADIMAEAWTERWSGRVGYRAWIEAVEVDLDNARAAFAWALRHDALEVMLALAPVLMTRALAGATYDERAAVAEAIDARLSTRPIDASQLTARVQLMRFWSEREMARCLVEADRALRLADASQDRLAAYLLNGWLVRVHAQIRDLAAATAALVRVEELEDPGWPAIRLWIGADARSVLSSVAGPPQAALDNVREELRIVRLAGDSGYVTAATLIDAELRAGHAAAAAVEGWRLVEELSDSRNEFELLVVRINLTAALLALDDVGPAKTIARATWEIARHFAVQGDCAAYLALICALEERWPAAAALIGYADACYETRGAPAWVNEMQARDRAARLSEAALGKLAFERLANGGALLHDDRIAAIAFDGR